MKKAPIFRSGLFKSGAGNETRTRDPNLGKVVLYQLSYSRITTALRLVNCGANIYTFSLIAIPVHYFLKDFLFFFTYRF